MHPESAPTRPYLLPPPPGADAAAPASTSKRSERNGNLASLRLRFLRGPRTRPGRQLQHGCALALAQARDQHYLSVRKFQRVMMRHGVVHINLPETRQPLPDLLVREDADAE